MDTINSFAPVVDANARVLILGSIPGKRSLNDNQYYAHPRNAFWRIMSQLYHFELPHLPQNPSQKSLDEAPKKSLNKSPKKSAAEYLHCLSQLRQHRIALWDVLQSCQRDSSLDADIVEASIQPNDFSQLFSDYPLIRHIYFNGAKAQQSYQRYVLPGLSASAQAIPGLRLPSTSPAHAALNFAQKLAAWQVISTHASGAKL